MYIYKADRLKLAMLNTRELATHLLIGRLS